MKRTIPWLLFLSPSLLFCQAPAKPEDPDTVYRELSGRLRNGDFSIDFKALRFACSAAKECEVRANVTDLTAEAEATKRKDWAAATQICERILSRGYTDVEIHADLTGIFNELDDLKSMRFHRDIVVGLLASIRRKKGDSKETAMEIISHREIYSVLASMQLPYFGPTVAQSSFSDDGHKYELYEVVEPITKQKIQVYFNVDHVNRLKDVTNRP